MTSTEAAKIIERVEAKIDANAKMHYASIATIKWVIVVGIAVAGVLAGLISAFA